jgi:hypothetical protein
MKATNDSKTAIILHDAISSFADLTLTAALDGKDVVIALESEPAADLRPVITRAEDGYTRLEIRTHEFSGYGLAAYREAFEKIATMLRELEPQCAEYERQWRESKRTDK